MIDWLAPLVLIGAALVLVSVLTSVLAFRFGAPLLLVFLLYQFNSFRLLGIVLMTVPLAVEFSIVPPFSN